MNELVKQLEVTKLALLPHAEVYDGLQQFTKLIQLFKEYMDKKIRKIEREEKVATAHLKKSTKATKELLALDKKQDAKLRKAGVKPQ